MRKNLFTIALFVACSAFAQDIKIVKMDTHSHVDVPMIRENMPGQKVDLKAAMAKAGMDGLGITYAVDYVPLKTTGQAFERFYNALEGQDSILSQSGMKRVLNAKQLEEAIDANEPFVVQCVEGAHFLEGDVSRIQEAYNRGLRIFCLLHDNDANPPLGDVYTNEPKFGGLTELGAATIRECNRLGILVDLAHCDSTTIRMALKESKTPVIISHTGLNTRLGTNDFMGKMMYKRLISPELAKEVAAAGGVIGVWPHLAFTAKEYAENIKAMVDLVGIDHVCLGTDTKITPEVNETTPEMMEEFKKREAEMKKRNEGQEKKDGPKGKVRASESHQSSLDDGREQPKLAKGKVRASESHQSSLDDGREQPKLAKGQFPKKNPNAVNHVFGDDPEPFYPSVIRELRAIGYSNSEIAQITGGNFVRLFKEVVK